ncbi:putative capsid protein [Camel associated porprismacovirus 3]|uniref:Putative capsid protein n=1 Tax=Camel associated porprismacovirus 3 TaxID=2170107 RepID=A0A0A1EKV4_9VIRU|nr:putative capsid protein [Camel associated porprismacovirus 3]AIY31249.1 putative capsid protein [Camel associated porprismacovirus 3]
MQITSVACIPLSEGGKIATNYVTATYQEIYDLNTREGKLSIIGIHTPTNIRPIAQLQGFFAQYKKFRYNGISKIAIQPAAQLPADPLQVSMEAGQTLDPRDLLNPILFHGAHGTSINAALNVAYRRTGHTFNTTSTNREDVAAIYDFSGDETPVARNLYYSALSDPSFTKFSPQQFIQLTDLVPMVHRVNTSMYFGPNQISEMAGSNNGSAGTAINTEIGRASQGTVWNGNQEVTGPEAIKNEWTLGFQQFFSNGMAPLDWMPTRTFNNMGDVISTNENRTNTEMFTELPKLYMGVLIFPPSYNQKLYFRMVITHSFSFKDFGTYWSPEMGDWGLLEYFNEFDSSSTTQASSLNLTEADAVLENDGVM